MKLIKNKIIYVEHGKANKAPSNYELISRTENVLTKNKTEKGGVVVQVPYDKCVYRVYCTGNYEDLVQKLVAEKYSLAEEIAIIRQSEVKPGEFEEYYNYVEECKKAVKRHIIERDSL